MNKFLILFILPLLALTSITNATTLEVEERVKRDLKKASYNYVYSILIKDLSLFKKSTSKAYYKKQEELGFVKKVFTKEPKKIKDLDFDIKIQKGLVDKDYYFVNLKEKKQKQYNDSWFIIRKIKNKFVIDGVRHLEE